MGGSGIYFRCTDKDDCSFLILLKVMFSKKKTLLYLAFLIFSKTAGLENTAILLKSLVFKRQESSLVINLFNTDHTSSMYRPVSKLPYCDNFLRGFIFAN